MNARRRPWIGFGALCAFASMPLAALEPLIELPLLDDRQLPMVVAQFGTERLSCLIDSGAQFNTLPVTLGGRIGVEGPGAFTDDGAGLTRYTRRVSATVSLGGATRRKLDFYLRDVNLQGREGPLSICILGQPYLKSFTWDLDGVSGRFRLYPRKTPAADVVGESTGFRWRDGFMTLPVVVDGHDAQAFVDSGASLSEINRPLQAALGIGADDERLSEPRRVVTLHRAVREADSVHLDTIVLAGQRLDRFEPHLQLTDSILARLFGRGTPSLLLGWDVLRRCRLVVDGSGRTLAVAVEGDAAL